MKTSVEPLEGNKVKLSIGIADEDFETALDAAYRKIAKEVRLPGFRPGKAPRRVLEARIGSGYARSQAIQDAVSKLPDNQRMALILNKYEHMSYEGVAEVMGRSVMAIKSLLSRARGNLRHALRDYLGE